MTITAAVGIWMFNIQAVAFNTVYIYLYITIKLCDYVR